MTYGLNDRAKRMAGRNKPPMFVKHQILGMLTRWSQQHFAKGLISLTERRVQIKITHTDLVVISYLLLEFMNQSTGVCLPNQATIAERIGCSRYTVNKAIRKWRILGVLGIVRRTCIKPSTGHKFPINTSCFYHLTKNIYKRLRHALEQKFPYMMDGYHKKLNGNYRYQSNHQAHNQSHNQGDLPLFDKKHPTDYAIKQDTERIKPEQPSSEQPIRGFSVHVKKLNSMTGTSDDVMNVSEPLPEPRDEKAQKLQAMFAYFDNRNAKVQPKEQAAEERFAPSDAMMAFREAQTQHLAPSDAMAAFRENK